MKQILVASSKGGVGKTTIASHIAAHYALAGLNTALVDGDPQGSSLRWARKRAELESAVLGLKGAGKGWRKKLPDDAQAVVFDSPAGAMATDLEPFLERVEAVVVPIQPSALDIEASVDFLDSLAAHPRVRKGELRIGIVGNRLKPWTNASQQALELFRQWPYPVVAQLRDSQAYVLLTGLGRSLFDYHSQQVREHQADWLPLFKWLGKPR